MPISNTSLKDRPAERSERRQRTPSERASAIESHAEAMTLIRRSGKPRSGRGKSRKRPIRLLVGAGVYTLALATITVTATELINSGSDQQDLSAAPTMTQLPTHLATHVPLYGPTLPPAPVIPSSTPPPAPAPAPKPVTKAGRAAARATLAASTSSGDSAWDKLAACESSGRWSVNTGNGYYGGLQFKQSTWAEYGGLAYAPRANEASRADQIAVARKVLVGQGWRAWPSCSRKTGVNQIPVSTVADGKSTPSTPAPATPASSNPAPAKPASPSQPAPPSTTTQPAPPTSQPPTSTPPTSQPPTSTPPTTTPPTTSPAPTTQPVTTEPTQPVTTAPTSAPPVTSPAPIPPVATPPVSMPSPLTHCCPVGSGADGATPGLSCFSGADPVSCLARGSSSSANGLIRWAQSTALSPPARPRS